MLKVGTPLFYQHSSKPPSWQGCLWGGWRGGSYGKRCKPAAREEMLRTHLSRCCHPLPTPARAPAGEGESNPKSQIEPLFAFGSGSFRRPGERPAGPSWGRPWGPRGDAGFGRGGAGPAPGRCRELPVLIGLSGRGRRPRPAALGSARPRSAGIRRDPPRLRAARRLLPGPWRARRRRSSRSC